MANLSLSMLQQGVKILEEESLWELVARQQNAVKSTLEKPEIEQGAA